MVKTHDTCYGAQEALEQAKELRVNVNALQRRADLFDMDKLRLGERVSDIDARMTEHESVTQSAVQQMNHALNTLNETVGSLQQTLAAVPMRGVTMLDKWRNTPLHAKAKLSTLFVSLLMAPDVIRDFIAPLLKAVVHTILVWIHIL